ncbi:MAG: helix-turn-helix domain-containing protein [Deltaproteobacteria bacterium]|nr:helix-turn-helix domain-containing protein [Deltaproteobacteria bacterium]
MAATNPLFTHPPYPVEAALKQLGAQLRDARLRRGWTLQQAAERVGAGVRAVRDAERGKPSSGIAVSVALLWAYGLLGAFERLGDPGLDEAGLRLARAHGRQRGRSVGTAGLDNDF